MAEKSAAAERDTISDRLYRVAADSRTIAKLSSVRQRLAEEIRAMAARA